MSISTYGIIPLPDPSIYTMFGLNNALETALMELVTSNIPENTDIRLRHSMLPNKASCSKENSYHAISFSFTNSSGKIEARTLHVHFNCHNDHKDIYAGEKMAISLNRWGEDKAIIEYLVRSLGGGHLVCEEEKSSVVEFADSNAGSYRIGVLAESKADDVVVMISELSKEFSDTGKTVSLLYRDIVDPAAMIACLTKAGASIPGEIYIQPWPGDTGEIYICASWGFNDIRLLLKPVKRSPLDIPLFFTPHQ